MLQKMPMIAVLLIIILSFSGCSAQRVSAPPDQPSQPINNLAKPITLTAGSTAPGTPLLTPAATQTVQPTVTLAISGSLPVPLNISGLNLDAHFIYWSDDNDPTALKRVAQNNPQAVSIIARSTFSNGVISDIRMSTNQRWLLYWDRVGQYLGGRWQYKALDLETQRTTVILNSTGQPYEAQPFASLAAVWDGAGTDDVALAYVLPPKAGECQRMVLRIVNLSTTASHVVKETDCAKDATVWLWPRLYQDQLVVEQDYSTLSGQGGTDILLYDLTTQQQHLLTQDRLNASPAISADYVIWKRAYRTEFGKSIGVYNRHTRQTRQVDLPTTFPKLMLNEHWAYWHPDTDESLYLYDLNQDAFVLVADAGCQHKIIFDYVAMRGTMIVWKRGAPDNRSNFLEWRSVEGLPPSNFVHCEPLPA